ADIGSDFIIFTSVVLVNTNLSEYYTAAKLYPIRFCGIFFGRLADSRNHRDKTYKVMIYNDTQDAFTCKESIRTASGYWAFRDGHH
ncbi:hypothetical protein, partial [Gelidibacter sp.]|uniref:hypothetical protein n=1 Tax=Gelidibacter sp. TaxID=2018083 RepID=UPI002BD278ED